MPIHSNAYLSGLISEQEQVLSRSLRAIFNRFEIPITANQAKYELPDNVFDILEVSWLGDQLTTMSIEDYQQSVWLKPNNLSAKVVRPLHYMLTNYGRKAIQFHPVPSLSIPATNGNLYTKTGYENAIVVTCYRVADPSGDQFRLRERLLRNTIKYRAMQRAYLKEGPGMELNAAAYFAKKAEWVEQQFEQVYQKIPKVVLSGENAARSSVKGKYPKPSLPTTGPWSF